MKLLTSTLFAAALSLTALSAFAQGKGDVVSITANSMATIDDVMIGAYNIRDEDFKDDKGADATRLSAALQIGVKGDPSKEQKMRVHVGQTFAVQGRSFEVKAVEKRQVQLILK